MTGPPSTVEEVGVPYGASTTSAPRTPLGACNAKQLPAALLVRRMEPHVLAANTNSGHLVSSKNAVPVTRVGRQRCVYVCYLNRYHGCALPLNKTRT